MIHFDMTEPCLLCPFRTDRPHFLSSAKANDIAVRVLTGEPFICHNGSKNLRQQQCVGTTIMLEKLNRPNRAMMLAESRTKDGYDYRILNMRSPVYDTFGQWIEEIEAEEATWADEEADWEAYLRNHRRHLSPAQRKEAEKTVPDPPVAHRVG